MLDHPVFQDDWMCRLFVWCLLKANYQKSRWQGEQLEPGQFITGKLRGAEELGVPPTTWYRGMQRLAGPPYSVITIKPDRNLTTVTVCNYTTYQYSEVESGPPTDHNWTANGPPTDTVKEFNNARTKEIPLPENLQTEEFRAAWSDWKRHRKEIKKALTPTQEAKQLAKFSGWGQLRAIAAIEHTIVKGWQGIVEPDSPNGVHHPRKTSTPVPKDAPEPPRECAKAKI